MKRVRRRIELAATMVRDHKTVNAHLHGTSRILSMQNAFEEQIALPLLPDLGKIIPIERSIQL